MEDGELHRFNLTVITQSTGTKTAKCSSASNQKCTKNSKVQSNK